MDMQQPSPDNSKSGCQRWETARLASTESENHTSCWTIHLLARASRTKSTQPYTAPGSTNHQRPTCTEGTIRQHVLASMILQIQANPSRKSQETTIGREHFNSVAGTQRLTRRCQTMATQPNRNLPHC